MFERGVAWHGVCLSSFTQQTQHLTYTCGPHSSIAHGKAWQLTWPARQLTWPARRHEPARTGVELESWLASSGWKASSTSSS